VHLTYRRACPRSFAPRTAPLVQPRTGPSRGSYGPSLNGVLAPGDARVCANGCGAKVAGLIRPRPTLAADTPGRRVDGDRVGPSAWVTSSSDESGRGGRGEHCTRALALGDYIIYM